MVYQKVFDWDRVGDHDLLGKCAIPATILLRPPRVRNEFPLLDPDGGTRATTLTRMRCKVCVLLLCTSDGIAIPAHAFLVLVCRRHCGGAYIIIGIHVFFFLPLCFQIRLKRRSKRGHAHRRTACSCCFQQQQQQQQHFIIFFFFFFVF